MFKPDKQIEYYTKRAPEYEQIYYRDIPERRKEIDDETIRLKHLVKDKNILDLACGTGYWTKIFSETARSITACDISNEMLNEAKNKNYSCPVEFLIADINQLPFKKNSFDFITLGFWFSHHPKQDYITLFKNLKSILKNNGTIWMIDNNPPTEGANLESAGDDEHLNNYKKRSLDNGEEYIIIKNYFSDDQLKQIFSPNFHINSLIFKKYYWSVVLKLIN